MLKARDFKIDEDYIFYLFCRGFLSYNSLIMKDVIVIGAGAVGAFIARELSRFELDTLVLEKENDVGDVTSMANSAIVHSGYDPVPGTKKAFFNVAGNAMFDEIAEDLDVEFSRCGSMTIAISDEQMKTLESLKERARENGVEAILLSQKELREKEPNISPEAKGALLCPSAGIVNPFTLVAHAFENALDNGVKLSLGEKVLSIEEKDGIYLVKTNKGEHKAKAIINAAGLHSEEIAKMMDEVTWSIRPRKGQYYVLDHYAFGLVNHVLFPLPSEKGKGILVTMTTSGNYLVGPSSEWNDDKDDFSTDAATLANVKEQATMMVPNIPFREQIRVFAGLRATPSTHDFIIEPSPSHPSFINVAGIESPGLVSSPAIGKYVVDVLLSKALELKPKKNWNPKIRKHYHDKLVFMSPEEKDKLIKENPKLGMIICNCEKVSLGEIEDELSRSLPCLTIKALKKRCRAGFGKCQGGFCQPSVLSLLAKHNGTSWEEVLYDKDDSNILLKEAK